MRIFLIPFLAASSALAGSISTVANFTTANQSIWQTGGGGQFSQSFFTGTSWGTGYYLPIPLPFAFMEFEGDARGYIGFGASFLATAGDVDATAPFLIDLNYDLSADGNSVLLSSAFSSAGDPSFTALSPQFQIYVGLQANLSIYGSWRACPIFGECSGDDYGRILDTGAIDIPIVSINHNGDQSLRVFGANVGIDTSVPFERKLQGGIYQLGSVSGNLFPFIQTTDANPHGNADLLSLNADLVGILQYAAANFGFVTPPLSVDLGNGVGFTLLSVEAGLVLGLDQQNDVYGGTPTVRVLLEETGQTFEFLAGQSISIPIPDGVEDPHFQAYYLLTGPNSARFKNDLGVTINPRLGMSLGTINVGRGHYSLFEASTPNFVPPIPVANLDFPLEGFNTVAAGRFFFDRPGSAPVPGEPGIVDSPEPATLGTIGLSLILLGVHRRRKQPHRLG